VVSRSRLKKNRADGQIVVPISAQRERRCRENISALFPLAELFAKFTLVFRLSFLVPTGTGAVEAVPLLPLLYLPLLYFL
jgi:hypothetical protein